MVKDYSLGSGLRGVDMNFGGRIKDKEAVGLELEIVRHIIVTATWLAT